MRMSFFNRGLSCCRPWALALLCAAFVLCGCQSVDTVSPVVVEPAADVRLSLDSFVNVHYGSNRSLPGWQITRTAIETTLDLWYEQVQVRQAVTDGTPEDLKAFLRRLPGPQDCDISVVYLGSIQDAAGNWEFTDGQRANWRHLLAATPPTPHPRRIVILDACHAAVVRDIPDWAHRLGTVTLLAAGRTEKTYQFLPSAMLPVEVSKHYPAAWGWGQTYLPPDWRKHISFLGLMWIQTVAETAAPPKNPEDWKHFFDNCTQNAAHFGRSVSRRWGSSIQTY